MNNLLKLIDELTQGWRYAGECGGDLYCFFCGEWQNTTDDNNHEPDCPYVKARELIDEQQQPEYSWQPVTMEEAGKAITEFQKLLNESPKDSTPPQR